MFVVSSEETGRLSAFVDGYFMANDCKMLYCRRLMGFALVRMFSGELTGSIQPVTVNATESHCVMASKGKGFLNPEVAASSSGLLGSHGFRCNPAGSRRARKRIGGTSA